MFVNPEFISGSISPFYKSFILEDIKLAKGATPSHIILVAHYP